MTRHSSAGTSPQVSFMRSSSAARDAVGIDLLLEEISPGHAVFSTGVRIQSPAAVQDGTLCTTLIDFALCAAVQSLGDGGDHRVVEFRMRVVRPAHPLQDPLRAVADVVRSGSGLTMAVCVVVDAVEAVRACGSATVLIRERPVKRWPGDSGIAEPASNPSASMAMASCP